MRKTNNNNFTIEVETIKSNTVDGVRKALPFIMNANADIVIIGAQMGLGKSFSAMEYMVKNPNTIFLTSKHSLLKELEKYFNNRNLESIRWRGITNSESFCTEKHNPIFKDLINLGYAPNFVCAEVMKCTNCEYKEQFKHTNRVLAPIQYLSTSYLTSDDIARFSTYIVDESIIEVNEYPYDIEYLLDIISPLYFFSDSWFYDFLKELLTSKNLEGLESYSDKISVEIKNALRIINDLIGEDKSLETEIWRDDIRKLSKFNIHDIIKSLKYQRMYDFEINNWYEPAIYKLFNLAQKSKIVLLHATFNAQLFEDLISSYSAEVGIDRKIKVKIFYTQVQNKTTKVYNTNPNAYYPMISLDRGGIEEVKDCVEVVSKLVGTDNIGVLSMMKYNKIGSLVTESFLTTGIDSLHYGNAAGLNTLQDKQVLIIAGTFSSGGIIQTYNELYLDKLEHNNCVPMIVPNGKPFQYCPKTHPKLNLVQKVVNTSELIDAFGRNRGLINDNRSIIAFSHIPEQIYHDFDVIEYENKIPVTYWKDIFKAPEIPLYELAKVYFEESEMTNTEIAKALNVRTKKGSHDSKLIKEMKEHYKQGKKYGL